MRCSKCNQEIDNTVDICPICGTTVQENIRVLTPEEKVGYHGVTIDSENNQKEESSKSNSYQYSSPNGKIYVKNLNFGQGGNWLTKVAIMLIIAAIAGFLLFVALPVALIGIGVGIVVWTVLSFLKG